MWVSTNRGISCLRKGTVTFVNYGYKDNIPVGNFSPASVAEGPDGTLYFGSNGGLCRFNPRQVLARRPSPPPVITRMTVYNSSVGEDSVIFVTEAESVRLSHRRNTFSVAFGPLDFAQRDEVEFSYRLQGLQDGWTTSLDDEITFRNLPPGDYRLTVRSRLRNQEWSSGSATVSIVIEPPLWLTWPAKLLYALCAAAIIITVLRYYNRNLHLRYLYEADRKNHEQEKRLDNERIRFYTNITHELRTPLTLIIGPLEDLMDDSGLPAAVRRKIEVIRNSAVRLNNLVSNILELGKSDSCSRKLLVGRGNIVAVIREICSKYRDMNRKPGVDIVFNAPQEIINVYFDREVINIIVDNLVSNAVKYTDTGRIVISVSMTDGEDGSEAVEIAVSDTGHGISAEALPHVFDRYYQERGPHQASGTGIGLSLVQSMVQLHEGTVSAESTPSVGSTFRVRLRADNTYATAAHTTQGSAAPDEAAAPKPPAGDDRRQQIMLVVEDNRDICNYIAESFCDEFAIMTADNGRDGLKAAFSAMPDIIISDIMMPHMDGTEMCRRLKQDVRTNHIPVILLTAKDSMESKEESYESGADSFITKPFVRSLIASRVSNLLRQRRLLAAAYAGKDGDGGHDIQRKRTMLRESMGRMERDFLDRIDSKIKEQIQSDGLDVDTLAACMNMSPSTLYRKMKALTGLSPNEYVRKYRMTYAEELLLEGKHTISEISFMVGISTAAYFRKCFKEEFGMTPSEYLESMKKGEHQG